MNISRKDLDWAVAEGVLSHAQASELWKRLESRLGQQPRFSAVHVAYYFGAMIVISAMAWFMTLGWESLGGAGIFGISAAYAMCFCLAARTLGRQESLQIPSGLLYTIAVCMVPLAVYGLEKMSGLWPDNSPGNYHDYHVFVNSSWILMELATIVAAAVMLRFVRFPFLTAPIAFSMWYLSMDLTPLLFGMHEFNWEQRKVVSVCVGLLMLLASYLTDRRTARDYSFWGYLFGLVAFWGGLSLMESGSALNKFLYCLINLGLMLVAVLLDRRVFLVFGALGVFGYLGYLSFEVFENSILFPFALTGLGIAIIGLGIQYQKHGDGIQRWFVTRLPEPIRRMLPQFRVR